MIDMLVMLMRTNRLFNQGTKNGILLVLLFKIRREDDIR